MKNPLVSVVMGSDSDLPQMKHCAEMLEYFKTDAVLPVDFGIFYLLKQDGVGVFAVPLKTQNPCQASFISAELRFTR